MRLVHYTFAPQLGRKAPDYAPLPNRTEPRRAGRRIERIVKVGVYMGVPTVKSTPPAAGAGLKALAPRDF